MAGNPPEPAPLPTNAGTATKVVLTAGAVSFVAAPAVLPYSVEAAAILASLGGALVSIGGVIHVYWDHSP